MESINLISSDSKFSTKYYYKYILWPCLSVIQLKFQINIHSKYENVLVFIQN